MSRGASLSVSNVSYTHERSEELSLKGIGLDVESGSFAAVMGETGAGKTTLLMTLNGLIPQFLEGQFQGEVEVAGRSTRRMPIQKLVREIGLVLQDPETQIFGRTVWEDVAFGPSNFGIPLKEITERVDSALKQVGLSDYGSRPTEFLSGGEKQRLAVAGVLAIGPRILALDEPTSELDPEGRDRLFWVLKQLQQEHGLTIVIAEHESEKVLEYADRVHVLQDGQLVWEGLPETLFADEQRVKQYNLRPPGVARLFWELKNGGLRLEQGSPRNVEEMLSLIKEHLPGEPVPTRQGIEEEQKGSSGESSIPAPSSSGGQSTLQIRGLHHTYPDGHKALSGIDLDVHGGEFIALIGQNGAGKSTLCKHLNCLLKPTAGNILYRGRDISGLDTSEMARHVGYVFQNPDHQIFSASVMEEVTYGLKLQGLTEEEQTQKALEVLSLVGLEGFDERHPLTLGKGLRQRLAVASVLALEPEVLIIDEPTTGQDWQGVLNMLALIRKLHEQGHTILAITHDMQLVSEYAERVIVMGEGKVVRDCPASEAFDDPGILREARLEPPQIVQIARRLELETGIRLRSATMEGSTLAGALLERMEPHA